MLNLKQHDTQWKASTKSCINFVSKIIKLKITGKLEVFLPVFLACRMQHMWPLPTNACAVRQLPVSSHGCQGLMWKNIAKLKRRNEACSKAKRETPCRAYQG